MEKKKALIIGTSRGLGFALVKEFLARGWLVVGTVRQPDGTPLHDLMHTAMGALQVEMLDITNSAQALSLKTRLHGQKFDLLFVNAGILNNPGATINEVSTDDFISLMLTNVLSPMRLVEMFAEQVVSGGIIGVMSSGLGSVADNEQGGYEAYRASKAALNTLMRSFAARHKGDKRSFLLMAPGWIKTDMGGPNATHTVEEAIPRIADTIMAQAGKAGLRYLDQSGKTVRW